MMKRYLCILVLLFSSTLFAEGEKLYDEDGNKIFENLQSRLLSVPASARIPVLIQYRQFASLPFLPKDRIRHLYRNFPVVAASLTADEIRNLAADSRVVSIELDAIVRKTMDTARLSFGVDHIWRQFLFDGDGDGFPGRYSSNDVVIAILDTGIAVNHPDLRGKILFWKDLVNGRSEPYDDEGHGTHVAGVAVGAGKANGALKGVAPGAALVVYKVLNSQGSGDTSTLIAALDEILAMKSRLNIRIINLSLAIPGSSSGKDALSQACNRAVARGIVVVAAAGNEGPNSRTIGSPGAAASVITVGAGADLGENGFYVAKFSSRGPTADGRIKPDLWAPGVLLRSPKRGGGYSQVSGTSFAAPFVAGVVALILDARPALTPSRIKGILMNTAVRWAPGGKSNEFGAGRLQAYQALARAVSATDLNPPSVPELRMIRGSVSQNLTVPFNVVSTKFPVAITLVILNHPSGDVDLELYSPSGTLLRRSATLERQENILIRPTTTGTYSLQLSVFMNQADYLLNISSDLTP